MKKILKIAAMVLIMISLTACNGKNQEVETGENKVETGENKSEKVGAYYENLPQPEGKVTKIDKNEVGDGLVEYIVYVDECSYEQLYEYIMSLEKEGFHYDYVNNSIPKDSSKLYDKTETSWAADNGKIWIRVSWRSNESNSYSGYNLQIIYDNYDYLLMFDARTAPQD